MVVVRGRPVVSGLLGGAHPGWDDAPHNRCAGGERRLRMPFGTGTWTALISGGVALALICTGDMTEELRRYDEAIAKLRQLFANESETVESEACRDPRA
jgi:hypothetical protein